MKFATEDIIHWTLIIILILLVIWAKTENVWNPPEITVIETCLGEPTNQTQMEELEKKGIVQKWTPAQQAIHNRTGTTK